MRHNDFSRLGWLFVHCVIKKFVVGLFVGWECQEIRKLGYAFLGWDDFQGRILVLHDLEDLLVCFVELESVLRRWNLKLDFDGRNETLVVLGVLAAMSGVMGLGCGCFGAKGGGVKVG